MTDVMTLIAHKNFVEIQQLYAPMSRICNKIKFSSFFFILLVLIFFPDTCAGVLGNFNLNFMTMIYLQYSLVIIKDDYQETVVNVNLKKTLEIVFGDRISNFQSSIMT